MANGGAHRPWYPPYLSRLAPFAPAALAFLAALAFHFSPIHDFFELDGVRPQLFRLRSMLGQAPQVSSKLKIFSYDDTTMASLGAAELTMEQWVRIIRAVADRKPSAIVVDKIFAVPPPGTNDIKRILEPLENLNTRLVTIAHLSPGSITGRAELDSPGALLNMPESGSRPWSSYKGWHAYGPGREFAGILRFPGHAMNRLRGESMPVVRIDDAKVIPHAALQVAGSLKIDREGVTVEGTRLPVTRTGTLPINYPEPMQLYRSAFRALHLVRAAESGKPLSEINEGDVVLILPSMYTGSADFTLTPVGDLPGGLVVASLLNSVLTHNWLHIFDAPLVMSVAGVLAGAVIVQIPWVLASFGVFLLFWIVVVTMLFSYAGIVTSAVTLPVSTGFYCVVHLARKYHLAENLKRLFSLLQQEHARLADEIRDAAQVSNALIPDRPPNWDGVRVSAWRKPVSEASGDWFAFESEASGNLRHFLMCDISGHGVQAAIIASTCRSVLSQIVETEPERLSSPNFAAYYAGILNRVLFRQGRGMHTTTLLAMTFDLSGRKLFTLACGHPRPVMYLSNGEINSSGRFHDPLGLQDVIDFVVDSNNLLPGMRLAAFTDGVHFPKRRDQILNLLVEASEAAPTIRAEYVAGKVIDFHRRRTGRDLDDDACLVWFEVA